MVACRITDARNIAAVNNHLQSRSTGSLSGGQVPLKKYKQTRISSLTTVLIAILHWIWPPDRCTNCHSIYSSPHLDENNGLRGSVGHIHRSVDGRFVLGEGTAVSDKLKQKTGAITNGVQDADGVDEVDGGGTQQRRNSNASQNSSSDDGGFLSRRNFINARASWRRPLVASPSQLSLQSASGSAKNWMQSLGGLLGFGNGTNTDNDGDTNNARYQNVYRNHYGQNIYRNLQPAQPAEPTSRPLHINTISGNTAGGNIAPHYSHHHHHPHMLVTPNLYTPSRVSRIFSSSPAGSPNGDTLLEHSNNNHHTGLLTSPWALATPNNTHPHFSDISTVYPGSADRSFPTLSSTTGSNFNRYRYYSHELPSLRTIQEETRRMNHGFVPLQIPSPPSWRGYPYHSQTPYHSYRPRTRWYPRHYSRVFGRAQSELLSPLPHLNLSLRSNSGLGGAVSGAMGLEASPESRSSSSGFGSKHNSNQPHGSHHSGSTSEWRLLPPYRPPPPPPPNALNSAYFGSNQSPQQAQAQAPVNTNQYHPSSNLSYYPQHNSYYSSNSLQRPITPPYTMSHWLDMISRLNAATDNVNMPKSVDVGSVDGHYEFDPSTPTPSGSTPTGGLRDDLNLHIDTSVHGHHTLGPLGSSIFSTSASGMPLSGSASLGGPFRKPRISRYENIEARLQSMKEEFYAYRKRQAMQRAGVGELESIC